MIGSKATCTVIMVIVISTILMVGMTLWYRAIRKKPAGERKANELRPKALLLFIIIEVFVLLQVIVSSIFGIQYRALLRGLDASDVMSMTVSRQGITSIPAIEQIVQALNEPTVYRPMNETVNWVPAFLRLHSGEVYEFRIYCRTVGSNQGMIVLPKGGGPFSQIFVSELDDALRDVGISALPCTR